MNLLLTSASTISQPSYFCINSLFFLLSIKITFNNIKDNDFLFSTAESGFSVFGGATMSTECYLYQLLKWNPILSFLIQLECGIVLFLVSYAQNMHVFINISVDRIAIKVCLWNLTFGLFHCYMCMCTYNCISKDFKVDGEHSFGSSSMFTSHDKLFLAAVRIWCYCILTGQRVITG